MKLASLLAAAILTLARGAEWIVEARVVGVSDGDTITMLDDGKIQHKVGLAGIDAPERGQAFGERSRQSLSALVFQKRVEVRCHKKEQIRLGMAWHYKEYQHEQTTQDRLVYRDEEESARARRVGLWTDAKPVPPWEWRKTTRDVMPRQL